MDLKDILNSKSLKSFIKGSLVLIGLFAVLYCGVVVVLFSFGKNIETIKISDCKTFALILILTILPLVVFLTIFFKFSCFLKSNNKSPCNKYEDILHQMKAIEMVLCEMQKSKEDLFKTQKNEETHLKMEKIRVIGEACLTIAKSIKLDTGKNEEALKELIKMLDLFSKLSFKEKSETTSFFNNGIGI